MVFILSRMSEIVRSLIATVNGTRRLSAFLLVINSGPVNVTSRVDNSMIAVLNLAAARYVKSILMKLGWVESWWERTFLESSSRCDRYGSSGILTTSVR